MSEKDFIDSDQAELQAESAVVQVVRGEVVDIAFKTAARVRARMAAYNLVSDSYNAYITQQAAALQSGAFAASAFKELGVARLVAQWMVESERFFQEMEPLLNQAEHTVRKGFVEESFGQLPEAVRDRLWSEFNDRKADLIVWFVERIKVEIQAHRSDAL